MSLAELLKNELLEDKFWTDRWHLVSGCTPVSPGCLNCWFAAEARVREHNPHRSVRDLHQGLLTPDKKHFNGTVRCNEHLLDKPLRARKPRVYAIWSDLFHESVPDEFRTAAFRVMLNSCLRTDHRFMVITKRPEVAASYLSAPDRFSLSNVTILVTMEDQPRADERAPYAVQLAAKGWRVGALCEPLLGPIHFTFGDEEDWFNPLEGKRGGIAEDMTGGFHRAEDVTTAKLSWIITGGESGHGARPIHPDWVRSLRNQAQAADVPFMFKSWGAYRPTDPSITGIPSEMVKVPRGMIGGRWLDGRCWTEVPA